ncbi:MAG TPA: phosphotransferase family protein [Steroidobacteraceae bacterium]|jgi:aminoglycoside phosphotransferase (APT) family kinase protein
MQVAIDYSRLDVAALDRWLRGRLAGYAGDPQLTLISGGQSTPTYLLESGGQRWVLRRRPPGEWPAYLFPIDREFQVLHALQSTDVPAPHVYVLCEDAAVIGGIFYVMEYVEGRVFENAECAGLTPAERRAAFVDLAHTCGKLHRVDWRAAGLGSFGRPGSFVQRQLSTMAKVYAAQATWRRVSSLERLANWLPTHLDVPEDTCLVHGDFRIGNCIVHLREPRIMAVLDWELSTLGNPMADAVYLVQPWYLPAMPQNPQGDFPSRDLVALGIPSLEEMLALYSESSGRPAPRGQLLISLIIFNCYRTAVINHGVGARAASGTAVNRDAEIFGGMAEPTADYAWQLAVEHFGARD